MTTTIRSIGTTLVALVALATTAAASSPAPRTNHAARAEARGDGSPRAGTFRAELRGDDGSRIPALLTIEQVDGKLDVMLVIDAPTSLQITSVSDSLVTGKLPTQSGTAKVTLHVTDSGVTGTIAEGRHVWDVIGKRTS